MRNFLGSRALPEVVYHRPTNIEEALRLLNEPRGEYRVIGGCTDLIPAIRRGAWSFGDGLSLVDIKGIRELDSVKKDGDTIRIGAATRLSEIARSSVLREHAHILCDAISEMGSLQVRNSGTIGGNLCTASPAADTAPPLLVLDARVKVRGIDKEELVSLEKFFLGPGKTILDPKQILLEIQFPVLKPDEKSYWIKMGRRDAFTLSVISVATWTKITSGVFDAIRIALGAVAPSPMRAFKTEKYLVGREASERTIEEAAKMIASEVKPISDVRASAEYRRDMSCVLTKKAIMSCLLE